MSKNDIDLNKGIFRYPLYSDYFDVRYFMRRFHKAMSALTLGMVMIGTARAGTFAVTGCSIVSAPVTNTPTPDGTFFSASGAASVIGFTGLWEATASHRRPYAGSYGSITSINPRFKWTVTWAPSYSGELPPSQGHCKLRMMGYSTVQGYMQGYPYQFTGMEIASTSLTAWSGINLYDQSLVPTPAFTNPYFDASGSSYQTLPDGDVYTGAFTLVGGVWTAYAEQQFPASIICTVHLGPPIGTGKEGLAEGWFKMKATIYEIDGQSIP